MVMHHHLCQRKDWAGCYCLIDYSLLGCGTFLVAFCVAKFLFVNFDYNVVFSSENLSQFRSIYALVENQFKLVFWAQLCDHVLSLRKAAWRWEYGINAQLERVLQHRGDQTSQQW